jgi:hypothetical protein
MLIVSPFFIKYFTPKKIRGIALFPFIIIRSKELKNRDFFIFHEKIHLRQQLEMLVLPFYIWYAVEFFIKLLHYKKFYLAYENISFEREAYTNENNLNYLKKRKFWNFINYL